MVETLSVGFTNSSLYTGDIDYVALPSQGTYWVLPLSRTLSSEYFPKIIIDILSVRSHREWQFG